MYVMLLPQRDEAEEAILRYKAIRSRDKASCETGTTTQQPQEEEEEEEDNRREHKRRGKAEPRHTYHVPPRDERT